MKRIANYIGFLIVITTFFSCNNSSMSETPTEEVKIEMPAEKVKTEPIKTNTVVESSNVIGQITIGNQIWSTKNLDVSNFRNGDIIPQATNNDEWRQFGVEEKAAWCYYDYNSENGKIYGKLYNWYAVTDIRGLAPNGWHVPTSTEFETFHENIRAISDKMLKDAVADAIAKGTYLVSKEKEKRLKFYSIIRSTSEWYNSYDGQSDPGSNLIGFSALPGGYVYDAKDFSDHWFFNLGQIGYFWHSDESNENNVWGLTYDIECSRTYKHSNQGKGNGASVRCIKD